MASSAIKGLTKIDANDVKAFMKMYEEERFLLREQQVQLRKYFDQLVDEARSDAGRKKRLVFFIDDIDRCMPDRALKMLEALKLYLNIPGCIFFLGLDRAALALSITHHYQQLKMEGTEYLDKIVQLAFNVPPIEATCMEGFIKPLLPNEIGTCLNLLVSCLGDNPRSVKRFINTLILHFELATAVNIQTDKDIARVLALVLLIQLLNEDLYRALISNPDLLLKMKEDSDEGKALWGYYLSEQSRLQVVLQEVDLPDADTLRKFIYLTETASVAGEKEGRDKSITDAELKRILKDHEMWIRSGRTAGKQAMLARTNLANRNLANAVLTEAILEETRLSGAALPGAILKGANLRGAFLPGANLEGANLEGANLEGANLEGANLRGAQLDRSNLEGAHLERAHLKDTNMKRANLENARLTNANLEGAHLELAILKDAHLEGANLENAYLTSANVEGAHLEGAILNDAHLEGANLENAHIINTQLQYADLTWASFLHAKIAGADFTGTIYETFKPDGADDTE